MVLVVYRVREVRMRVQRVLMPNESESWTVLDGGGEPVGEVEAFLAHLQALDRSPTTLRTYATSLKLWLQFLEPLGVAVDEATVENVSRFVGWLRAPAENVAASTVNRHLAALFSFYDFRARGGVVLAQSLVDWRRTNRGGYLHFLNHVTAGRATATRPLRLRQPRRLPRTLTCLLYTSDAADEEDSVDLGGRRIIKKKNQDNK